MSRYVVVSISDVQNPAVRTREHTIWNYDTGTGAVSAQEVGNEWVAGIGRLLIPAPVPVRKANAGVARDSSQIVLQLAQEFSMPREERRSPMPWMGARIA